MLLHRKFPDKFEKCFFGLLYENNYLQRLIRNNNQ